MTYALEHVEILFILEVAALALYTNTITSLRCSVPKLVEPSVDLNEHHILHRCLLALSTAIHWI